MSTKKRLDLLIVDKGLAPSRHRARALIMAGKVLVNTICVDKPGSQIQVDSNISIKGELHPFVSRGGLKLEAAINEMGLSVKDRVCMDVGASTGGFTDCLLQHGALKVYAVDVGYGQLAWKIRQDKRVVTIERTNIRHLPESAIADPVDVITIDTSFISLKIVVPAVEKFMHANTIILALIKPQFEAGKGDVGKKGIIKSEKMRQKIISNLIHFFESKKLRCGPVVPSPILGSKGNHESIILLTKGNSVL